MKKEVQKIVLTWLRLAAKLQLKKNSPTIIGVTGSAGKTSTIRAIDAVLQKSKFKTKTTLKGNSETGIPFEILNIPVKNWTGASWIMVMLLSLWRLITYWPKYELLIVEMGIDSDQSPKNMKYLLSIVQPTIGVLLNVNHVHGANFSGSNTLKAITKEKGKLLTSLPANGLAIYSQDYPSLDAIKDHIKAPQKTFSINKRADIQLLKYKVDLQGTEFVFLMTGKQYILKFTQQLLIKESFGGLATALHLGKYFEMSPKDIIDALENNLRLLPGRSSLIAGINNSVIIDSSYNSSLEPTRASLNMMSKITIGGKKIAVLGDMREIGEEEKNDHEKLAKVAAKSADVIFLIGPLTKKYMLPKLKKLKFAKTKTHSFMTAHEAVKTIKKAIDQYDLILVKGSQNTIFLEIIVKAIMADPQQADKLLCRQSRYWNRQRKNLK